MPATKPAKDNSAYPDSAFALVRKDDKSGTGIVCYKHFSAGEVLSRLQGEVVPEVLQHTLQIAPSVHLLDRDFCGYFLHSCAPNISVDMEALVVTALCDIEPGDYLFMDYAETEDVLFKQFQCQCGSPRCRGWITGRKESKERNESQESQESQGSQESKESQEQSHS